MAGCQPDIPYVARFLCPVPDIRHWEAALHFTEWRGMTPASKDSEGNVVVKYISPTLVYIAYTSLLLPRAISISLIRYCCHYNVLLYHHGNHLHVNGAE